MYQSPEDYFSGYDIACAALVLGLLVFGAELAGFGLACAFGVI